MDFVELGIANFDSLLLFAYNYIDFLQQTPIQKHSSLNQKSALYLA